MKINLSKILLVTVILLSVTVNVLWHKANRLAKERDKYIENTNALLSEVERIQVDSTRMALDVKTLRLTVSEYEQYRAEDAALIKKLGLRVKDLEAAARHQLVVEAPIVAPVKDSVIVRDTVLVPMQIVEMITPYIEFKGMIEDSVLMANVRIPVMLNQAIWIEYKHRFLWWRWKVKAVHQTITSDNPHVEIEYSEYVKLKK